MLLTYKWLNFLVAKFVPRCLFLWRKMIPYYFKLLVLVVMRQLWGGFTLWCALQIWSNTFLMFLPQGRTGLECASLHLLPSLLGCLGP